MTLTLGQLRRLLDERECGYSDATVVRATATTPFEPPTFEISYLTGSIITRPPDNECVVLHLVEVTA